ncbi:MAG: haloacid dehalogenase type II [Burkholderiaceae bacterium]|jgi:2-haloacid dehalogenase|nr:haloacid dehalogenase type II [Burkholderiales bacterium]MCZ8031209.1 haloacid dehalogenase type II [Rubrivivax sp.]MCZ8340723.1 haloacid dehalogenase type II [Burkholderiaceae bacterium]
MPAFDDVQVLAFDVFGTVVDWRGSIAREVDALGLGVDGAAFADAWRAKYQPAMQRVREGNRGWVKLDVLHRENLDATLDEFGVAARLDDAARVALNLAWHRLDPWPEAVAGLARLKRRFVVTPLSNGNVGLLTRMAKRAGLPWDCVLSAEVYRAYKPEPGAYLGVADTFDLRPAQVMMVAAHASDLRAAAACGLRTAYVDRPLEFGPDRRGDVPRADDRFDVVATGFDDLAARLDC